MSINTTIARPYAKAAFAEAMQHKNIPAWSTLLQTAGFIVRDPRVSMLLQDPRISAAERLDWLLDICAPYLHPAGKNLFKLLGEQQRLGVLPEIAELFAEYRVEQEKIARVEVTSALALSGAEQQHLINALKLRLQREITLECTVDSALLGGLIVKSGDWVLDGSIRGKLSRLSTALIN